MPDFTFAVVGDIGCRPGGLDAFEALMPTIASHNPALLLITGNMMQGGTPGHYSKLITFLKAINRRYALPIETTPGPHDTVNGVLPADYEKLLGVNNGAFSFSGVKFISVDSSTGGVSAESLESMRRHLSTPAFVMTNTPPAVGPWEFKGMSTGTEGFLEVLKDSQATALGCFFGRVHAYTRQALSGVPSFTVGHSGAEAFQLTKHGYSRPASKGALIVTMRGSVPHFQPIYSMV